MSLPGYSVKRVQFVPVQVEREKESEKQLMLQLYIKS